ncbi:hypothetical protein F2Q69_00043449 [Brassica cretica]|uniref:Uncharacterized protein n=1 Tax=Brassica cretica TaxID=69181 RepID=A0A8S9NFE1_BRACR|nr:hypothetical protein F2Q69_00043449 [Brassica cretica]
MEFQSFEEMLEYDANTKEVISEEVHQILQTVSRSRNLSCYGGDMPGQYSRDRPSARNS